MGLEVGALGYHERSNRQKKKKKIKEKPDVRSLAESDCLNAGCWINYCSRLPWLLSCKPAIQLDCWMPCLEAG